MKYKKIVIIPFYTFERRTNTLFGVRNLLAMGIEVEYWDISAITKVVKIENDNIEGIRHVSFPNKRSFRNYVKDNGNKETLYLLFLSFCNITGFCFRILSKYNLDMAYCINGVLPLPSYYTNKQKRMLHRICQLLNPIAWKDKILVWMSHTGLYKPIRYQLNTCRLSTTQYKVNNLTVQVPFNSTDYVFSQSCEDDVVGQDYIVFIDQNLPNHPDGKIVGYNAIDPQKYYAQLNLFFDNIERYYNCKVVIAAHPTAKAYNDYNPFNGRTFMFGRTQPLVKYSIGVISHFSTAFSFAVLYHKPILILTSNDIIEKMNIPHQYCCVFSETLGCPIINIDELSDIVSFVPINIRLYEEYKYNYITNIESENKDNAEILYNIMQGNIK